MTAKRTIAMSKEEISRCEILRMTEEKQITQKEGARRVGISQRHLRRLLRKYRLKGAEGIISGHRGKQSNNRMSEEKKKKILNKLKTDYEDFGPTFASEKLWERDGIKVSKETVHR
ncbi:MAG: helix-turn-helix domain-containing protein [Dehalococcoidales bacterium]